MLDIVTDLRNFLSGVNPLYALVLIYFVGMYVFWRGSAESHKNRSSVFDMFLLSGLFSVLSARIAYIIVDWAEFSRYIWYWIPYEKYGDRVFFFRLLPWRFFSIWDGGLVIITMFTAILLFATFYVLVIKKWRWKHMFFPVYFSATTMLGLSFLFTGFVSNINDWIFKGAVLVASLFVYYGLYMFFSKALKSPARRRTVLGLIGLVFIWATTAYIGFIYMSGTLSLIEKVSVIAFIVWSVLSGILFILDIRRASVSIEGFSNVRPVGHISTKF